MRRRYTGLHPDERNGTILLREVHHACIAPHRRPVSCSVPQYRVIASSSAAVTPPSSIVTMWIVYALTIGKPSSKECRWRLSPSRHVVHAAGYVRHPCSLWRYRAWLHITRTAPVRADRFTMTSILSQAAPSTLWLALWH